MSLINDALKRAQQADPNHLPKGPTLRPVELDEPRSNRSKILLPTGLLLVALAAFLVIWKLASVRADALATTRMTEVRAATPPPAPAPAETGIAEESPQPEEPEVQTPEPAQPVQASAPQPPPASQPPAQPVAVLKPSTPPVSSLKLQSIVFSKKPSAMISGMFVYVGDAVGDLRVTAIRENKVELSGNGETIVLTLY